MPAVTLNGTTFTGNVYSADSVRKAPTHVNPKPRKIGTVLEAASGARNMVLRNSGTPKVDYELTWDQPVAETTRAAVRTIFDLSTTFTAILPQGTVTVQCELEDYEENHVLTLPDGTRYFEVKLTLR